MLPAIRVPALILHRTGDREAHIEEGRYLASRIPAARFVELPGEDHLPWVGDWEGVLDEAEEFLTGARRTTEGDRVLSTVVFTDLVGSTDKVRQMGDRNWALLLQSHDDLVRREIERYRGREVKTTGDGFLAMFDGPARAVRCAMAIREGLGMLGLQVRAGLHTGEVEVTNGDIRGVAVHAAARVMGAAGTGEVLVSSTVRDLVAGSGLRFESRRGRRLKGLEGEWSLYAAEAG